MKPGNKYPQIGRRLKAIRTSFHPDMSTTAYTKMIGVGYTRYLNWESGLNRPLPDEAVVFCEKFGVDLDFIYRGREAALPQNVRKALSENPLLNAQSTSTEISE